MNALAEVVPTEDLEWHMWNASIVPTAEHDRLPIAPVTTTIDFDLYFKELVSEWKRDTGHLSLISQRINHPAYKRIITMGRAALPLILAELRDNPDHWFHALYLLADENPIPQSFHGSVTEAIELWVDWGCSRNLLSDAA